MLTAKGLSGAHRPAVTQAFERSVGGGIQEAPFESDTCIGQWHYKRDIEYKSVGQVIRILVDVVSKNGTLLLSIPQRGDGTIDDKEREILKNLGQWMRLNGEGIYGTRPWRTFGEGPTETPRGRDADNPIPYTAEDLRFTTKKRSPLCFRHERTCGFVADSITRIWTPLCTTRQFRLFAGLRREGSLDAG